MTLRIGKYHLFLILLKQFSPYRKIVTRVNKALADPLWDDDAITCGWKLGWLCFGYCYGWGDHYAR